MLKKHIATRRERNRALAEREAHLRCRHCHVKLESVRIQMGQPFCSVECEDDDLAFQARWQAAKAKVSR